MGRESNPVPVVNDVDGENYPQDFHYVADNCETSPMMVNRTISSLQVHLSTKVIKAFNFKIYLSISAIYLSFLI